MAIKGVARPFIKWAGGKTQLLPALFDVIPRNVKTYFEPFLGGGSVFFAMAGDERFERAVLNDCNPDLVNAYKVVRDFPDDLLTALRGHMTKEWNTVDYFQSMRALLPDELDPIARAARMIYLNKTCFNGLYRQNKRKQFNTPFGRYKNPSLFDEPNMHACSRMLNRVAALHTGDFSEACTEAGPGDVVYFDPPYVPISLTANFASYTSDGFDINDQHRLSVLAKILRDRGATVIISNSDTETTRVLYEGMEIIPVMAKRHINSRGDQRGPVGEILAVHYGPGHEGRPKPLYEVLDEEEESDAQVPAQSP